MAGLYKRTHCLGKEEEEGSEYIRTSPCGLNKDWLFGPEQFLASPRPTGKNKPVPSLGPLIPFVSQLFHACLFRIIIVDSKVTRNDVDE